MKNKYNTECLIEVLKKRREAIVQTMELHKLVVQNMNEIIKQFPDITVDEVYNDLEAEHPVNLITDYRKIINARTDAGNSAARYTTMASLITQKIGRNNPALKLKTLVDDNNLNELAKPRNYELPD